MVVIEDDAVGEDFIVALGPGSVEASGVYKPTGKTWHGAPVFENDQRCCLSREPHKSQKTGEVKYGWILGQDRRPLYAVQSEDLRPPAAGWRRFQGQAPLPELRRATSLAEADAMLGRRPDRVAPPAAACREKSAEVHFSKGWSVGELAQEPPAAARALHAFAGYGEAREQQLAAAPQVPLEALPYHNMGLPPEQVQLMDGFFKQMRDEKASKVAKEKEHREAYERIKDEFRESVAKGVAARKLEPLERILPTGMSRGGGAAASRPPAARREDAALAAAAAPRLSEEDQAEIDALFAGYPKKAGDRREEIRVLSRVATEQASKRTQDVLVELHRVRSLRGGEPGRFEQAAGEVYCWWRLPHQITGKDVQVRSANEGRHLTVAVRGVTIFSAPLFAQIRSNETLWYVASGELHLTLTKGERSKLWEQLSSTPEVRVDAGGNVIPDSVPEPMSSKDRMDRFRQMIEGDDGERSNYDDLPVETKRLVDAMRRYEHARATGDHHALALAEMDLEEFGRLVV